MRRAAEWKVNALVLLTALGIAALYGGATSLTLWALDCNDAVEIGGIVSTATGGFALPVALVVILYIVPRKMPRGPISDLEIYFFYLAGFFFYVLILPPLIITFGWSWRWLTRKTGEEKHRS